MAAAVILATAFSLVPYIFSFMGVICRDKYKELLYFDAINIFFEIHIKNHKSYFLNIDFVIYPIFRIWSYSFRQILIQK